MHILLIGCGRMGGAMLERWGALDFISCIDVVDRHVHERALKEFKVKVQGFANIAEWRAQNTQPDLAVLAIKPQALDESSSSISNALGLDVPVLSVAVGISLARLTNLLGQRPLIRSMPNTASAIGKGVTGYAINAHVSADCQNKVTQILQALGSVVVLHDEGLMNALSAISGSAPAYFYLFTEALAEAGVALGLEPAVAMQLARQSLIGTGALVESSPEKSLQSLRAEVTSPKGTTLAALNVYEKDQALRGLVKLASQAAVDRAIELGQEN